MRTVAFTVVVLVGLLLWYAVWPPHWAPRRWRHWTRPLRRRLRPGRYR